MKAALDQGLELSACGQKLTKIADRSELGWRVVAEYEADKLASDRDNEKKLEKVERSVERKESKKWKGSTQTTTWTFNNTHQSFMGSYPMVSWSYNAGYQTVQSAPGRSQMPVPKPPVIVGPCFNRGKMDHLKRFCPRPVPGPSRWYPHDDGTASLSKRELQGIVKCGRVSSVKECASHVKHWGLISDGVDGNTQTDQSDTVNSDLECDVSVDVRLVRASEQKVGIENESSIRTKGMEQARVHQEVLDGGLNDVVQSDEEVHEHCMWPNQDLEHEATDNLVSVKGRLANSITFWK